MIDDRKFNLMRAYYSHYISILYLKPGGATEQRMKGIAKASAIVYNKTLDMQIWRFQQNYAEPLRPVDIILELPVWKEQAGLGILDSAPLPILKAAISDACKKVSEAFKGKQDFKFPLPITGGYKHFEFTKGVRFDPPTKRLKLPGFDDPFMYNILYTDPSTKGELVGDLKKMWIVLYKDKWIVLLWTRAKLMGSVGAIPVLKKLNRKRIRILDDYLYDPTHWIVVAHLKREAGLSKDETNG